MFLVKLAWSDVLGLRRRFSGLVILTLLAVTAVGGSYMLTSGAETALRQSIGEGAAQRAISVGSDFGSSGSAILDDAMVKKIQAIPGVQSVEPTWALSCVILDGTAQIPINVVPVRSSFPPPVLKSTRERTFPLAGGEIVLPSIIDGVDVGHLLGQDIEIERSKAKDEGESTAIRSTALVVALSDPAWQDDGPIGAYVSRDEAWSWYQDSSLTGAASDVAQQGYRKATVMVETSSAVDGVLRRIQAAGLSATSVQQLTPQLPDQLRLIKTFANILLVVVVLLAVIASAFLVRGLVFQRTREIGLLKALGYRSRAIWTIMATEMVIVAWIGAAAGIVCAVVAANVAKGLLPSYVAPEDMTGLVLPSVSLLLEILMVSAAAILAGAVVPLLRASHLDPARALRDVQ